MRLIAQGAREFVELGLFFKADSGGVGYPDVAIFDGEFVGETAEGLKYAGIGFISAEVKSGGDIERHLVAAVGNDAARRPAVSFKNVEGTQVFDKTVGKGAVELEEIRVGVHAAVAEKIGGVPVVGENIFSCGHRAGVVLR